MMVPVEYIREHYPDVSIITNSRNEGYTKAINQALKCSKGDYKVILNPDSINAKFYITDVKIFKIR